LLELKLALLRLTLVFEDEERLELGRVELELATTLFEALDAVRLLTLLITFTEEALTTDELTSDELIAVRLDETFTAELLVPALALVFDELLNTELLLTKLALDLDTELLKLTLVLEAEEFIELATEERLKALDEGTDVLLITPTLLEDKIAL
jgi:hypothetical protein